MRTPEESTVVKKGSPVIVTDTAEVAAGIIEQLDSDFPKSEVLKIAEWIHYLSTQD